MSKKFAIVAFGAALALPPTAAFAVSGTTSGYGTQGYGPRVPTRTMTRFERSWNASNESKRQARSGAEWMRRHNQRLPTPW